MPVLTGAAQPNPWLLWLITINYLIYNTFLLPLVTSTITTIGVSHFYSYYYKSRIAIMTSCYHYYDDDNYYTASGAIVLVAYLLFLRLGNWQVPLRSPLSSGLPQHGGSVHTAKRLPATETLQNPRSQHLSMV